MPRTQTARRPPPRNQRKPQNILLLGVALLGLLLSGVCPSKTPYEQNICFGGFGRAKERCYLKGLHFELALKFLKRLMPGIQVELNFLSAQDFIRRKGRVDYPRLMQKPQYIRLQVKKELESLAKVLAREKKAAPGRAPREQGTPPPRILLEKETRPGVQGGGQTKKTPVKKAGETVKKGSTGEAQDGETGQKGKPKKEKGSGGGATGDSLTKTEEKSQKKAKKAKKEPKAKKVEENKKETKKTPEKAGEEKSVLPKQKKGKKEKSPNKGGALKPTGVEPEKGKKATGTTPEKTKKEASTKEGKPKDNHIKPKQTEKKADLPSPPKPGPTQQGGQPKGPSSSDRPTNKNPGGLIGKILSMSEQLLEHFDIKAPDQLLKATVVKKIFEPLNKAFAERRHFIIFGTLWYTLSEPIVYPT